MITRSGLGATTAADSTAARLLALENIETRSVPITPCSCLTAYFDAVCVWSMPKAVLFSVALEKKEKTSLFEGQIRLSNARHHKSTRDTLPESYGGIT